MATITTTIHIDQAVPKYISIYTWQAYLTIGWGKYTVWPKWMAVPYRDHRYGNAANVCLYTPQMEAFLSAEGIRYGLIDQDGETIAVRGNA